MMLSPLVYDQESLRIMEFSDAVQGVVGSGPSTEDLLLCMDVLEEIVKFEVKRYGNITTDTLLLLNRVHGKFLWSVPTEYLSVGR